jgi:5'-nucleotidase
MRILVTNDDGVGAPGLIALVAVMVKDGHDVVVAAPFEDMSGSSAAIGPVRLEDGVALERVSLPDLDGVPAYAIEGPPALAVIAARLGAFGEPPDMVAAGVNPGANTGRSVLHSGTVGAALTAANFGVGGLAVSQVPGEPWHVETATAFAAVAVEWLAGAAPGTVLNLNVPNRPVEEVAGVRVARLAPFGTVRAALEHLTDGRIHLVLRETEARLPDDTDTSLVQAGYAAVTSLVGIRTDDATEVCGLLEREVVVGR